MRVCVLDFGHLSSVCWLFWLLSCFQPEWVMMVGRGRVVGVVMIAVGPVVYNP